MKKILYLVGFLFLVNTALAQLESRYAFGNAPPLLLECSALGIKTGKTFAPPAGASFKITNMYNNDTAIGTCLLFGTWSKNNVKLTSETDVNNYLAYNCRTVDTAKITNRDLSEISFKRKRDSVFRRDSTIKLEEVEEYRLYFLTKVSDLAKISTPIYQKGWKTRNFVVGTQTKLLKIRLKQFDFAKDFSLSSTFGYRIRISRKKDNFLNFVSSIGVSLNDLDVVVAPKLAPTETVKSIGALSVGFGIIQEFSKVQFSIMLGKDYLSNSNNDKYDWIYNKKTWISIGVGIGIFTNDDGKKTSKTDSQ
jgi:hypothetical protein